MAEASGGGALALGSKKMGPIVKKVAIIGVTAVGVKYASDALVERLFVQEDGDEPRTADEEKMVQLQRGGIQIVGGVVLGRMIYKKHKEIGIGVVVGGTVGGLQRIAEAYEWDDDIRGLFDGEDDEDDDTASEGLGRGGRVLYLNDARMVTGPAVSRPRMRMVA